MTWGFWIKHSDISFIHGRGEGVFKKVRPIFKTNSFLHIFYRKLFVTYGFNKTFDIAALRNYTCMGTCMGACGGDPIKRLRKKFSR